MGHYLVPNPDDPERMMRVPACVMFAPCPTCKAPIGVPCRGSLGDWIEKGTARGKWWQQDRHYPRANLWTTVKRLDPEARAKIFEAYPTDMERRTNFGELVDPEKLRLYEERAAHSGGGPIRLPAARFQLFKSKRAARYSHMPRFNWRLEIRGEYTCSGPGYDSVEAARAAIYSMSEAMSGTVSIIEEFEEGRKL